MVELFAVATVFLIGARHDGVWLLYCRQPNRRTLQRFAGEAVEKHLTGKPLQATRAGQPSQPDHAQYSLRAPQARYIVKWTIPILILLFIPVIGSILWLVFGAWMMAIQYADYPMGNHGLSFSDQRKLLGRRRLTSLGFGAVIMMSMVIPVVNFVIMRQVWQGLPLCGLEGFSKLAEHPALPSKVT